MPVWLQLVSVFSSALFSGLMGIALIPFLEKCKFCLPESESDVNSRLRPTMCGILLIFGTIAGLVLNDTLYLQFGEADRTGLEFQTESHALWLLLGYALIMGFAGWRMDYLIIKRKWIYPVRKSWRLIVVFFVAVFLLNCAWIRLLPEQILDFGFWKWDAGVLSVPIRALMLTIFWQVMQIPEQETDGMSITLNSVQLLFLSILLLAEKQNLYALYGFTTAGASIGCLFWNLHPAKCKLGHTGLFWLGAVVPALCMMYGKIYILFLYMIVYLINLLPMLNKKKHFVMLLKDSGYEPLQRIALLAGFALFCGALTVMLEA